MTELEKAARMALEFCEFCWRDVSMNDYALEKLEQTTAALTQALATAEPVDQPAAPEMFTGSAAKFTANFLAKHTRHTSAASRAKRRREIADAQINVLKSVVEDLRRKARETPAWRNGYCSSITSLEHQIALIQSNY